jgi:hypothetical protein
MLIAAAASFAMLATPMGGTAAVAKTKTYQRYAFQRHAGCPLRRTVNGDIVDCNGWRLRSNAIGWDNSCFNLDYLPSQFACSSRGGR